MAILGGNRLPFARANTAYAHASNQDMLTAAIDGLVDRFDLRGERLGEVVAGAVLKHSRDFNLTRECVLGSRLSPETPAYDIQQACDTGIQAAIAVADKIAVGAIEVGIAGGVDTASDAPIAVNEKLRKILLEANRAKSTKARLAALARIRPTHLAPSTPQNAEPRTRLSMGEHAALTAVEWDVTRRGAGRADAGVAPAARGGVRARSARRAGDAVPRAGARREPASRHQPGEARLAQDRSSARARRPP